MQLNIRGMPVSDTKTYLFDSIEIVKTGRRAERKLRSGKIDSKIEITPADTNTNGSWTKWVKESELYGITS